MRSLLALLPLLSTLLAATALAAEPPAGSPATPAQAQPSRPAPAEPRSYGTRREAEPPRYTRDLASTGLPGTAELDWLTVGLEYRLRYEHRDNDFRRSADVVDTPLLLRGRAFAYVRGRFDPFRAGVELQDSRRHDSAFPPDDRDSNTLEPIQAFGELYLDDALGSARPLSLKAGRFAFEVVDRRLIARNEWRNTTNTFQGLRASLGDARSDWQLDLLALEPLTRDPDSLDRADGDRLLWGALLDWRRWSPVATLQPYWLLLDQDANQDADNLQPRRRIHTLGLRAFGAAGVTGFDYDAQGTWQTGRDGLANHRAFAGIVDLGYTFDARWRPRASLQYLHVTGDRQPDDAGSQRFERLFGFARPLSANDYFQLENLRAPKFRLEASPRAWLRVDAGYNRYWLDSATDRWNLAGLRDPSGASGRYLGQELDARARATTGRFTTKLGYAWFDPGRFTVATSGRDAPSHFLYLEIYLNAFR